MRGPKPGAHTRSVRPCLEALEDRWLPSATFGSVLGTGSAGYDAAFAVATDRSGNVYMGGYFSGTVDFDPNATNPASTATLTAGGDRDIFVAKYAPDGSFLWASQMTGAGTGSTGVGRSLALDGSGNVYLGGYFGGTIAFGSSTLTSAGSRDG